MSGVRLYPDKRTIKGYLPDFGKGNYRSKKLRESFQS